MSNKMTGLVEWFNESNGFSFITRIMVAKICSFTFLPFKVVALRR